MKKQLLLFILALLPMVVNAQKDVTKFLGIPVDGYKSTMIQKLKAKGYTYVQSGDFLKGEFNGSKVKIYVVTNNNKVYRIMLLEETGLDEANIKIKFNKLVSQFKNNKRYSSFGEQSISDDEDISYEMLVNNKIYEALFYQDIDYEKIDSAEIRKQFMEKMSSKYTQEQLEKPTEEITTDMALDTIEFYKDLLMKKPVWFRIVENYGRYYIAMFYDNEWNKANGEDL